MSKKLRIIFIAWLNMVLIYLLLSFTMLSVDFRGWPMEVRFMYAFFGTILSFVISAAFNDD